MMHLGRVLCVMFVVLALGTTCGFADDPLFVQHQNVVYAEVHGVGLVMDIFVPKGEKNGLAVVDVVSGAWHSDRGKIRDHMMTQTFHILCKKGYTVFPANDSDEAEDKRFGGGYISRTYGGNSGTGLDALQLELGGDHRSRAKIDTFAADLAAAVKVFSKLYLPQDKK